MKRGWLIVLIVAVCAVVAIVAALVWPGEKEPVYQGKKLSEWIDQAWRASGREQEARFAIRQIGTNALPFLVKWIESADASSGTWMEDVADKMSVSAGPALGNFRRRKFQRAKAAVEAFQFLGADARAAIPDLKRLSRSTNNMVSVGAQMALDCIQVDSRTNRVGTISGDSK